MAGRFPRDQVDDLLVRCHRRCCVCHRFCGVKIETDHIDPSGPDTIDNAIPVCFNCHAEIHSYNDDHPRGRKFRPEELRMHRDQWLGICERMPGVLLEGAVATDVGPLQALIDELEFNARAGDIHSSEGVGALFCDQQFLAAIHAGAIAVLKPKLKDSVLTAYAAIRRANQLTLAALRHGKGSNSWNEGTNAASSAVRDCLPKIGTARSALLEFLGRESDA